MRTRVGLALACAILALQAQEERIDSLISQLETGDVAKRREAVYEIWKLKDRAKRATVPLAYALSDEDDYVRETAARALEFHSLFGVVGALAPLEQALRDKRAAVRRDAARLLATVGPDAFDAIDSLKAAMRDEDAEVRRHAASAFSHFGPKGAAAATEVERLLKEDPDGRVRMWAANALFSMGTPESSAPALLAALKDKEPGVRDRAVGALQVLWPEVQVPVDTLLAMLADESATTRNAAAMGLRRYLDDPKVRDELIAAAGDPEPWAAGGILGTIGDMKSPPERAVLAVAARLTVPVADESAAGVRVSAIFSLTRMGPAAAPAVPALLSTLDATKDGTVAVAWALGAIGPAAKEAVPALRKKLDDSDHTISLASAGALHRIAGEGLETLTAALADPARAKFALSEIGRIGAAGAAPAVRKLLEDEGLRRDAAIALYRIGGASEKEAYAIVLDAARGGDDTSCRLAVWAMRDRIAADEAAVTVLVEVLKTRDDGIRYLAAEAIRNLGPAARPALPALRKALATAGPPLNIALKDAIVAAR